MKLLQTPLRGMLLVCRDDSRFTQHLYHVGPVETIAIEVVPLLLLEQMKLPSAMHWSRVVVAFVYKIRVGGGG